MLSSGLSSTSWSSFSLYATFSLGQRRYAVLTPRFGQVAYQRILQLTYVDDLLDAMKTLFLQLYEPIIVAFVASLKPLVNQVAALADGNALSTLRKALDSWDKMFDKLLRSAEDKAAKVREYHFIPYQ